MPTELELIALDTEFDLYLPFSKRLVLNLPDAYDRSLAAQWLVKLRSISDNNAKKLRNEHLKLLLFALHRRTMVGVFSTRPPKDELESFHDGCTLLEMTRELIEIAEKKAQGGDLAPGECPLPKVYTSCSSDLKEFAASQTIPKFGAHVYYAISTEPLQFWSKSENSKYPGMGDIPNAMQWETIFNKLTDHVLEKQAEIDRRIELMKLIEKGEASPDELDDNIDFKKKIGVEECPKTKFKWKADSLLQLHQTYDFSDIKDAENIEQQGKTQLESDEEAFALLDYSIPGRRRLNVRDPFYEGLPYDIAMRRHHGVVDEIPYEESEEDYNPHEDTPPPDCPCETCPGEKNVCGDTGKDPCASCNECKEKKPSSSKSCGSTKCGHKKPACPSRKASSQTAMSCGGNCPSVSAKSSQGCGLNKNQGGCSSPGSNSVKKPCSACSVRPASSSASMIQSKQNGSGMSCGGPKHKKKCKKHKQEQHQPRPSSRKSQCLSDVPSKTVTNVCSQNNVCNSKPPSAPCSAENSPTNVSVSKMADTPCSLRSCSKSQDNNGPCMGSGSHMSMPDKENELFSTEPQDMNETFCPHGGQEYDFNPADHGYISDSSSTECFQGQYELNPQTNIYYLQQQQHPQTQQFGSPYHHPQMQPIPGMQNEWYPPPAQMDYNGRLQYNMPQDVQNYYPQMNNYPFPNYNNPQQNPYQQTQAMSAQAQRARTRRCNISFKENQ